ncbi:MAG: hypothetical protein ACOC44_08115 [Promethearchaeia archaeon]
MEKDKNVKKKISVGIIASDKDLRDNPFLPKEVGEDVPSAPYFLLIFIPRKEVLKISCFPTETEDIKKILIKLKEFSPDLVKGITEVLNQLGLSKDILHTTGLCYDMENCYYETYLSGVKLNADQVKKKFMEIAKVISVKIEEIPMFSL